MIERIHSFGWAVVVFLTAALFAVHGSKPLPATMPKAVDVNGVWWTISLVDAIDPSNLSMIGLTDCATRHIYISRKSMYPRVTAMHEINHAGVCTNSLTDFLPDNMYYNSTKPGLHEGIYRYSEMWAEILSRNPQLAAWLAEKD